MSVRVCRGKGRRKATFGVGAKGGGERDGGLRSGGGVSSVHFYCHGWIGAYLRMDIWRKAGIRLNGIWRTRIFPTGVDDGARKDLQ